MKRISYHKHIDGTLRSDFFLSGTNLLGVVLFQNNEYNIITEQEVIVTSGRGKYKADAQRKIKLHLKYLGVSFEDEIRNKVELEKEQAC